MSALDQLTRRDWQRLQERARGESGTLAELVVAEVYGVEHDPHEWYDCVSSTGTKIEVKSAHEVIDGEDPSQFVATPGRFRLWRGQHRSLVASNARGTAWYVFVLFDEHGSLVDLRRMRPSTVGRIIRDTGGWARSGHPKGMQAKIPVDGCSDVLDVVVTAQTIFGAGVAVGFALGGLVGFAIGLLS
jgi:hypothetical protein